MLDNLVQKVMDGTVDEVPRVKAVTEGDLVLLTYTRESQYRNIWTFEELVSRGLIINRTTGEIVARPFDKFFNWFEGGRKASGHITHCQKKIDGSLGIFYWDGSYKIATLGAFGSEQAIWATKFLNKQVWVDELDLDYTWLFEIVYPENQIVVDYGNTEALVLLAARNRFTGKYLPFHELIHFAQTYDIPYAEPVTVNRVEELLEKTGDITNEEGWVVWFSDGSMWKIKGDEYREQHRLLHQLSFKGVVKAYLEGRLDYLLEQMYGRKQRNQVLAWKYQIEETCNRVHVAIIKLLLNAPEGGRKAFAKYAKAHPEYTQYLFAALDGKLTDEMIIDNEF